MAPKCHKFFLRQLRRAGWDEHADYRREQNLGEVHVLTERHHKVRECFSLLSNISIFLSGFELLLTVAVHALGAALT